MPTVDVNIVALVLATLVSMVVGFIWYSPALFAKPWAQLTGRKMNEMGNGVSGYVITTVAAFVQAFILLHLVTYAAYFYPDYSHLSVGVLTAVWAWVGFVFVPQLVNGVFAGSRKKLLAINSGYFLVILLINGVLLASML
jgi:hypothetical protein